MRRTVILCILLLACLIPKQVSAEGQRCCETGSNYNRDTNQCGDTSTNTLTPLQCKTDEGEECFTSTAFDFDGVCTKPENVQGECQCPDGYVYQQTIHTCLKSPAFTQRADPTCGEGQYCYNGTCLTGTSQQFDGEVFKVCDTVPQAVISKCVDCMVNGSGSWTAIGCIDPSDPSQFIGNLLKFGIGIAGGIAFLLILIGGFQMMTGAGNPEQLNAGRELIGSAITGLLLIIFSVFILKVIGVDILEIPGFSE
jgi:hypothetical protein